MKLLVFVNSLGLGGTEKAACHWASGLKKRGYELSLLSLSDGPRRAELELHDISTRLVAMDPGAIAAAISADKPDVIHTHAPGLAHQGDVLGEALQTLSKIPVVQTNIFGRLENPRENAWTDFRLFISWTSCVQAARRSFRKLDREFFRKASVAVYPLDADDGPPESEIRAFRRLHGVGEGEVLFGRFSRPEPNKWTDLPLAAFRLALKDNPNLKLLLREPPPRVAEAIKRASDCDRFIILPATSDAGELRLTQASLDAVLHTSSIGESFGYGIAEPMNYGKPVITNSTPWQDQAQVELVRHGEGGYLASTPQSIASAILELARDPGLRKKLGENAKAHIRKLAGIEASLDRVENALRAVVEKRDNPLVEEDFQRAMAASNYLDQHQFGHCWRDQMALRPLHYRVRFNQWRRAVKARILT